MKQVVWMFSFTLLCGCAMFGSDDGKSGAENSSQQQSSAATKDNEEQEAAEIQKDLNITPQSIMNKNAAKGADAEDPDEKRKR